MNVLPINKSGQASLPLPVDARFGSAAPFDNNFDDRFYFASSMHDEAMSRLLYLAEDGNFTFGLLTGPCGSGKSFLRKRFQRSLNRPEFSCVAIESPLLDMDGMLLEIISQIKGLRYSTLELADRYSRLAEFKSCLNQEIAAKDKHLLISIDEAHLLENNVLEELRLLTNITAPLQNLFTILLIGQPGIEQKLNTMPALEQRIGLRVRLSAMDCETCVDYVKHRMQIADIADRLNLSTQMYATLSMFTGGIPRRINNLFKLAVEFARINNGKVDDTVVSAVISDQSSITDVSNDIHQDHRRD